MENEENKENEEELVEDYKIRAGKPYKIIRQEFNGKVFYKIKVIRKNKDGTIVSAYKMVAFKDNPDIPDGTKVILKKFFEDFYFNKKDTHHYTPIFFITVMEWERAPIEKDEINDALDEYNESKYQGFDNLF